jgi:hypothetical protein
MLRSPPFIAVVVTPQAVADYLRNNGWDSQIHDYRMYWVTQEQGSFGYFTWEQALAYTMFRKLHLGLK